MLPQHSDERGEQGDKETRVHEASSGNNIARWTSPNGRNGGGLTGDGGLVESEGDGAEEGGGFLVGIGLEVGADVDDESGADGREQTRL